MNLSALIISILTGLTASIIFTLSLYTIQRLRYNHFLKKHFHNVSFKTYWKRFPAEPIQEIKCVVKRNVIIFSGKNIKNGDEFAGEIIMEPIHLKNGSGYHIGEKSEKYGFLHAIIKDKNCIVVEAPYTKVTKNDKNVIKSEIVPQAFIWRKN